jgi:hypothetical protein
VYITSGFVPGDTLGFTNQNGITGSYNATNGELSLSGSATLAQYQAALQSVSYSSSSEDPTANNTSTSRTITWTVTDANSDAAGAQTSVAVTSTVNLTAVNDKPVLVAGGLLAYTENDAATAIDTQIQVSDVDDTRITRASVTITAVVAGDVLSFTDTSAITGSYNANTGELTLTGNATLADYRDALRSVKYSSTNEDPTLRGTSASRTITWLVTDAASDAVGAQTSVAATSTINSTAGRGGWHHERHCWHQQFRHQPHQGGYRW